jgi:hypothetical protein
MGVLGGEKMAVKKNSQRALRILSSAGMLVSAVCIATGMASATPLNTVNGGTLNLGNFSVQVQGTPATGCINFYSVANLPDPCSQSQSPPDQFTVNAPVDQSLFVFHGTGNIKDITGPFSPITQFITTTGAGSIGLISFDLLNLTTPSAPACTPSTLFCAIPGTPFLFSGSDSTHTTVSFAANFCGYSGASGGVGCSSGTLYTGTFSAQFAGTGADITSLINQSQVPGPLGGITDAVSATLNPVPEPMTPVLFGSGLLALSMVVRRFRTR